MNTLEVIAKRKSTRDYNSKQISNEALEAILKAGGYRCSSQVPEHEILKIVRMYAPIITEFFDNEEEMAKFQKWREEYEEKERLEKEEKAKKKAGAANVA